MEGGNRRYRRIGLVTARRLAAARDWTVPGGDVLHGETGDWLITSADGGLRTAKDWQFRASHENVEGETWRRTGEVTAWQVVEETVIDTLEGPATARIGDWVVTAPDGSSWPVPDGAFRAGYEEVQ